MSTDERLVIDEKTGRVYRERLDDVMMQQMKPDGVFQTLRDGTTRTVPYKVDDNGEEYIDGWQPHQLPLDEGSA